MVHDLYCCMFRITLDSKGTIGKEAMITISEFVVAQKGLICRGINLPAALCYLPTRFKGVVEFYHTVSGCTKNIVTMR